MCFESLWHYIQILGTWRLRCFVRKFLWRLTCVVVGAFTHPPIISCYPPFHNVVSHLAVCFLSLFSFSLCFFFWFVLFCCFLYSVDAEFYGPVCKWLLHQYRISQEHKGIHDTRYAFGACCVFLCFLCCFVWDLICTFPFCFFVGTIVFWLRLFQVETPQELAKVVCQCTESIFKMNLSTRCCTMPVVLVSIALYLSLSIYLWIHVAVLSPNCFPRIPTTWLTQCPWPTADQTQTGRNSSSRTHLQSI